MHKKLLKEANEEQLRTFVSYLMGTLKARDYEFFRETEDMFYRELYGCHFNKWSLEKALEDMVNEDGTKGGHWTVEQTNQVAQSRGIAFNHFNEYDFNYVMNMIYSDYYGAVSNDVDMYVKLAKRFLMDKDAKEGKAYKYYINISY